MNGSPNFDVEIELFVLTPHSFNEISPLLDDLNEHWVNVSGRRVSFDPPAAGAELALLDLIIQYGKYTAAGAAGKAAWDLFFAHVTSAAGKRIQARLVETINRSAKKPDASSMCPFSITCENVRFYFLNTTTQDDLRVALSEAHELGNSLPEQEFRTRDTPDSINGYYWDYERRLWLRSGSDFDRIRELRGGDQ